MTLRLIGWAILHSLWQGGVIALIAAALLAATRRPGTRYFIALASLAAMLIVPILTAQRTMSGVSSIADVATSIPAAATSRIDAPRRPQITPSAAASAQTPVESTTPVPRLVETITTSVEPAFKWMIAVWILGLLVSSIRLMGGLMRTRSITRREASTATDALVSRVAHLRDRLGVTRAIRILESTSIDVPLVIGAIRPVIVVPVSLLTTLTPMQLDMLLAHELAHIRRHDYVINLIQTVIETLLFYHPAASWISSVAREERENCCDDVAVQTCGGSPTEYTTALLALEESRGAGFGLAAAATGGSLLKRARRLITGKAASIELGPRWIAGVITIAAAMFTGNEAFGAIQTSFVVASSPRSDNDSTKSWKPDPSRAAPSSVTKAPVGGSLAERWKWAERNSGSSRTWIGYLIGGDESEKNRMYVSEIPVHIKDGNVTMSGRINFGDGDLSTFAIAGVPLAPIVGAHSASSTAIFLQVEGGITGRRVTRVHLGTFALPAYFSRLPLVWLDSADDNESVSLLRAQLASARDEETRRDLVSAIGAHRNKDIVTPALLAILESRDVDGVRQVAAEWLGRTNDSRAIAALSRAARSDRADAVRRESIEAFSHMSIPAATDTLIAFSRGLDDYELRRVAIEGIGYRPDDRAFNYLVSVINGRDDIELRRRAAEAIADMPGQRGASTVIELAQKHPDAEIRRQFVESLARLDPPSRALDLLRRIAIADPSEDVRAEAVETIGEVDDSRAIAVLTDIAHASTTSRLRREALETLASVADNATAVRLLVEAAKTDPNEEVRRSAMEGLGDAKDPRAMAALESLVKSGPNLDARIMALEVYTDAASPGDAALMLRNIAKSDANADMREKARELLADLAKN
jgi:beta-lactamase regulating signal transducer with metallopeptidase domain/HEAT repeat protein